MKESPYLKVALQIADILLPIFEEAHHGDVRPREAIAAVKQYIKGDLTIEGLIAKRNAAISAADSVMDYSVTDCKPALADVAANAIVSATLAVGAGEEPFVNAVTEYAQYIARYNPQIDKQLFEILKAAQTTAPNLFSPIS